MRYMLLIHHGDTPTPQDAAAWERLSDEERQSIFAGYGAINQTPGVTPGERMAPPEQARTVRVQDGRTVATDGPFAEVKEALGGYFFFEADDEQAALDLAAKVPAAQFGGAVEVRPIVG